MGQRFSAQRVGAGVALGVGVGVALISGGAGIGVGIGVGVALASALGLSGGDDETKRPKIDPFAVGEPWRQFTQASLRSADKLHDTVERASHGPLKDRLVSIAERIDHGVDETWRIAQRGDEIDAAVNRLDPTSLRSKLATLEERNAEAPAEDLVTAIASVESQLATTDRLKDRSTATANTLRLAQTRLDELVTRAAEIAIGAGDTAAYEHDVDDLVIELEALRQAIQEVQPG